VSSDLASRATQTKDISRNKKKLDGKGQFWLVFRYIALSLLFVIAALPIYIMVINSVKGITGVSQSTAFIPPTSLDFGAWSPTWEILREPMFRTLWFVLQSSIISAIIGSINGFVFAKWRFKGSTVIFTTFLFGMFIPYQAIMIPLTQFNKWAGIGGTIYVLVFAHVIYGIPICTLIFRNYYQGIPNELIEAARVVLIWQFTSAWNDFLFAIFLTGGSPKLSVATTALNFITGSGNQVYYGNNMTASLIVSIPTLLVYMFLGRYFLRGLLSGSLKG
jgi:glucose/mannose transport system permease protein